MQRSVPGFLFRTFIIASIVIGLIWLTVARPFVLTISKHDLEIEIRESALETHVRKLSEEFVPRDWSHPENLRKTAQYIAGEFRNSNTQVGFQSFQVGKREYRNVFSRFSKNRGPLVVIGAHYDAYGELPGADDNASGVAGLIELGRMLKEHPIPINVLLVAFSLEEPPHFATEHMGSAHHAELLARKGEEVLLMISLEMIGYFNDRPGSQDYPHPILRLFYPSQGDFITIVGGYDLASHTVQMKRAFLKSTDIPVYSMNAPRFIPGIDFSDHRNYWSNGFPAIMVTDTAFYRNKSYHTANDTADSLDYEKMGQVVAGVYAYLRSL